MPHKARSANQSKPDANRPNSYRRGYTRRWNTESRKWLRMPEHRLCEDCAANGRTTLSAEVHHTTRHEGSVAILWDTSTWVALCKRCHSVRTRRGE